VTSDKTKNLLTNYLRKLTNLSGNSRSIFLPKINSDQFIDLQQLSQLNGEKAFTIIESLIAGKQKAICPVIDTRMEAANEVSKKLKKLQRIDHFIFEERGSRDLHVGWPFVRGKFSDGTLVNCPLLFFPVVLKMEKEKWVLLPREDSEISFNKSFLLAYSFYNQVKAEEELLDETFDGADRDSTVFRTQLYQLLQKAKMEIHFNPDNYRDELTSFTTFKKDEFEEKHRNGELKLFPEAVLGIFSQAGSFLVPDYLHLLEENSFNDLEEFFHKRSPQENNNKSTNFLNQVSEDKVYSIFPLDSWQENALKASKLGHSLVVQGPPGTGKSQLICNLISDAISMGKKVLVVCQKRAALDVVYARMKEHNLSDFLALVHDFKNDRKEIFQKIAKQIQRVDEYKSRNISLDAIQLERQFFLAGKRIDQITEELESFRSALFDESECGRSVKQLYLLSKPTHPAINLKQEYQYLKFDAAEELLRKIKSYSHYATRFKLPDYFWAERKSFARLQASDLTAIKECLEEIPLYFDRVKNDFSKNFNTTLDWEQCEALIDRRMEAITIKELVSSDSRYLYFQKMMPEQDEETSSLWLANIERVAIECYDEDGIERSLASSQLGQLQQALYRSMKARRSLIGLVAWELFSKDKFLVKRALVGNQLESDKKDFKTLERKLDRRLNLEHNLSKLKTKTWLHQLPDGISKTELVTWFSEQQSALKAKLVFNSIRGIKNLISTSHLTRKEFTAKWDTLFQLVAQLPGRKDRWLHYLLSSQISKITQQPELIPSLIKVVSQDFDALVELDRLEENLSTDERIIIDKLTDEAGTYEEGSLTRLFQNSLCLAWIDHIEMKHPELRMASSGKLLLLEQELKEKMMEKQAISGEILLLRARECVTENLEFNRLNNQVTYRDLLHQVTKKKKIWPLRKVVAEFEDEVFKLLPCWLASPESVSAIFPMREIFDLVIFDEASQCFAERGIPALYRGKQTVIAGDSKQLKPGDFYQVRWQEEDEDPDTEIDSLLELANRYLLSVQLQGHYRSKSLELIDFSNRHFYGGKLQLIPELQTANQREPVIDYVKVEGVWESNTNQQEAGKVVELLFELYQTHPDKEVGVITFNAPQQMLILDKLEEKWDTANKPLPPTLFVKNIENVQGDERDIIIFSVAYAPDKKGKMSMQFGSLNAQGGENRLNVAVSRAREKVVVVTSIWPDQLSVEETKNEGPKLLKAYLQFSWDVSKGTFKPFPNHQQKAQSIFLKSLIKEWFTKKDEFVMEEDTLPFYDLTAKKNGLYVGAILSDDENYYQSLSAKAGHAQTPQLLERKNWPFLRVYSRNYWQDPDRFFNEVGKLVSK
jgi:superfamily I DNA and/or RNA helicase